MKLRDLTAMLMGFFVAAVFFGPVSLVWWFVFGLAIFGAVWVVCTGGIA